jgi:hypothetical protein
MPKRFTEADKWTDKWFRRLPPDQKLAYLYILDRCDMAGTIEIDEELAEFQMGCPTDWEGLVKGSGTRLVPLPNGRIWVSKFIDFQHGKLSEACNAHKSALSLIQKYSLPISNENKEKQTKGTARVKEPLAKGPGNGNGNGNGSGKKKGGVGENEIQKPDEVAQQHWNDWLAIRKKKHRVGPPTKTAWARVVLEANKAGVSLDDAVRISAEKEWRGFESEWMGSSIQTTKPKTIPAEGAMF